jgi:maleate cis-trans isomerase
LANGVDRHRAFEGIQKPFLGAVGLAPLVCRRVKHLGAVKLAVATSFIPAHNELVRAFLVSEGFDVLGIETLDTVMTSLEKAMLSPTQVFRHVQAVGKKYSTCDAVLITSSAWPTLTVIQALEDDLGKPVVSSSIGQIWWPLKELGIKAEIKGYGKLLGMLS